MPQPSSTRRINSLPPCSTSTSMRVLPASTEFSSSSLTTLAGRSITSPAAILVTTSEGSWCIRGMVVSDSLLGHTVQQSVKIVGPRPEQVHFMAENVVRRVQDQNGIAGMPARCQSRIQTSRLAVVGHAPLVQKGVTQVAAGRDAVAAVAAGRRQNFRNPT